MTRRPRAGDAVNMATKAIGVHPKSKLSAGDTALGGDTYVSRTPDQPALYLSGVLGLFIFFFFCGLMNNIRIIHVFGKLSQTAAKK